MARPLDFRIGAVGELHRQLAYAPEEARLRQLMAAERLLDEIDPSRNYAIRDVTHRITGYRPDDGDDSMLVGEALRADLAALVQRLSGTLDLRPDDRPGGAETVEALAARLGVTLRTVQRWRRCGLALHQIRFDETVPRLGCYSATLAAFAQRHGVLQGDRTLSRRVDEPERDAMIRTARELARTRGLGPIATARAVAGRSGRAVETVRRVLRQHDAVAASPIFGRPRPSSSAQRRLIERAWRWGIAANRVAARCGRSEPSIHRQLMVARADRLRAMELEWTELPTFARPEAEAVILNAPAARSELGRLHPEGDTHTTLAAIRARPPVDDDVQEARLAASGLLRRRAAAAIAELRGAPNAATIDRIETDLRWALLLLLTAVADGLPIAVRRGESAANRPAERMSGEALRQLFAMAIEVAAETLPRLDPARRQSPSRLVTLEMDKALARAGWEERRGRAVAVVPTAVAIERDPCAEIQPWQRWVDLPARWPLRIATLDDGRRRALTLRHGLDGAPPRTNAAVAESMGISTSHAERLAHDGEVALRCAARLAPRSGRQSAKG